MTGGIVFSVFGFLMNPQTIEKLISFSKAELNGANILFGWISPLNHATYYMHNFGYDNLPRLWQSDLFFAVGGLVLFLLSVRKIRTYNFSFTGTQH